MTRLRRTTAALVMAAVAALVAGCTNPTPTNTNRQGTPGAAPFGPGAPAPGSVQEPSSSDAGSPGSMATSTSTSAP